jgi:class 3 adenylate cyclase
VADGVGYAAVLSATGGIAEPVSQWFFLMAVLAATAVMVGGLAERADRLARAERETRLELAATNAELEVRVARQIDQVARLERLRRFLSPPVADAVLSAGTNDVLQPHRRRIGVLFCDLRGFTRFTASAEPEDVVELLEEYYECVVSALGQRQASIGAFAGDGIMAYFGDPVPVDDPARAALLAAQDLNSPLGRLLDVWKVRGFDLGYGIGIAYGYATLGMVGTESRCDYTPIGSVVNLAARLCDEARSAEIVLDHRAHAAVANLVTTERCSLELKGFNGSVEAYRVPPPTRDSTVRPLRSIS